MKRYLLLWMIIPLALLAADLPQVKRSFYSLPFSNGQGAGVYQAKKKGSCLLYFFDHLYKAYDEKTPTKTYIRKGMYWGINDKWLSKVELKEARYIPGTGIVEIKKQSDDLEFTEIYFMPYSTDKRIIVTMLDIKNNGEKTAVTPYFYQDNGMGGAGSAKGENCKKQGNIFTESKGNKHMITLVNQLKNSRVEPYKELSKELRKAPIQIKDRIVQKGDNLIGVYQLNTTELDKGSSTRYMIILGLSDTGDEQEYIKTMKELSGNFPPHFLEDEMQAWEKWHKKTTIPSGMKEDERQLFYQSTAILRMGQVLEKGKPYGQILASMPPGMWNIAWVRDGAYSLLGLIRTGHLQEAKWGLEFMLNAPNGKFDTEEYIGKPYKISVCRYWGNGDEESDYNNYGPNLEWDNFGLFLWSFAEYVKASGDQEFLKRYYPIAKELVADVLIHLMTDEGYLVRDSSIWERHWEPQGAPDGRKYFSYSTINAVNGLRQLASISPSVKDKSELNEAANKIHQGFIKHMISKDVIVSTIEEKKRGIQYHMDGSVVEAINFGLVDDAVAKTTLKAFEKYLGMENSPGFLRNDDAKDYEHSWYDEQEWVVIDLRVAHAYHLTGNTKRAYELNRWVVENAKKNYYLIPELLEQNKLSFEGAVPMMGFGPGAFIINMYQTYGK